MVHLDSRAFLQTDLYFDIQRIEAKGSEGAAFILTGVLGDGCSEGQVLVDIGERVDVVFVEEWLGGNGLRDLFRRIERETVVAALCTAVGEMRFCIETPELRSDAQVRHVTGLGYDGRWFALRPAAYDEQLELPLACAEGLAEWERQAA